VGSVPLSPCEALVGNEWAFLDLWRVLLHAQGIDSSVRMPKTRSSMESWEPTFRSVVDESAGVVS